MAFERSRRLRPALGDRRGEGWMLERIGRAQVAEGRIDDAYDSLGAAHAIADEIQDAELGAALKRTLACCRIEASTAANLAADRKPESPERA
jgi:hypothetical protein